MSLILNAILKLERDFIDLKNNKKQISNKKHMVCIKYVEIVLLLVLC